MGQKVSAVLPALLSAISRDAVKKETIEALVSSLKNATAKSTSEPLASFPQSDASKIVESLEDIVKKSGRPIVLLIDRVEELSTPGVRLLQFIGECSPSRIVAVIAINSECVGFGSRPDLRELIAVVQRDSLNRIVKIDGYSADDIRRIKRSRSGLDVGIIRSEQICQMALGGRAGLLDNWFSSNEDDPRLMLEPFERIRGRLHLDYAKLEPKHKQFVHLLVAVYPDGIPLDLAAGILGVRPSEMEDVRRNFLGSLVREIADGYSLSNGFVARDLLIHVGKAHIVATVKDFAKPDVTRNISAQPSLLGGLRVVGEGVLEESAQVIEQCQQELTRGATMAAYERADFWLKANADIEQSSDVVAKMMWVLADAYGQLGDYEKAINQLDEALSRVASPNVRTLICLSKAEKLLRQGHLRHALSVYARLLREAALARDSEGYLRTAVGLVSTLNDCGRHRMAWRICELALREMKELTVDNRIQCKVLRTAARTRVLLEEQDSLEAVNLAKEAVAVIGGSNTVRRDRGNAQYAMAEVYRHKGLYDSANQNYASAIDIARDTANADLLLYCLLGLIALKISADDIDGLDEAMKTSDLLSLASGRPELAVVRTFQSVVERKLGHKAPYGVLAAEVNLAYGRPWMRDLEAAMSVEDIQEFKQLLQKVRIVL